MRTREAFDLVGPMTREGSSLRTTSASGADSEKAVRRLLGVVAVLCLGACTDSRDPAIRVDRASFVRILGDAGATRLEVALEDVLERYPRDFPQPPPIEIVLRVVPPQEENSVLNAISYGGMRLEDGRAIVEVHPASLAGPRALNDAELRSFLGHEVTHGYQCVRGSCSDQPPELWRREVEALSWELAHMGPEASEDYREDTRKNLAMYRELLVAEGP